MPSRDPDRSWQVEMQIRVANQDAVSKTLELIGLWNASVATVLGPTGSCCQSDLFNAGRAGRDSE